MKLRMLAALTMATTAAFQPLHAADGARSKADVYLDEAERVADWHDGWSDATVSGDLVFVSGVMAGLRESETEADVEAALERAFNRIDRVLRKSSASWADVVDMTVYMTDVEAHLPSFGRVRLKFMRPPFAASTVVQVSRLVAKRGFAEIRVTAHRPPPIGK